MKACKLEPLPGEIGFIRPLFLLVFVSSQWETCLSYGGVFAEAAHVENGNMAEFADLNKKMHKIFTSNFFH
jgi:hypothetical protein